jgi:hypothetical protein
MNLPAMVTALATIKTSILPATVTTLPAEDPYEKL